MNLTIPSVAEDRSNDRSLPPTITIRAFNYAETSHHTLAEARNEAIRIFSRVGVKAIWLQCRFSSDDVMRPPACEEPLRRMDFVLRILPRSTARPTPSGDTMLGISVVAEGGGFLASVFFDRVQALAARSNASRGAVLGHAAAHEIGHLLLGTNNHSRRGLMRTHWDNTDLRGVSQRSLRFTPQEAALIRAKVTRRLGLTESAQTSAKNQ